MQTTQNDYLSKNFIPIHHQTKEKTDVSGRNIVIEIKFNSKMPFGYLATFFIALLFPWLYRSIMAKKLKDWDENYASESEKQLLANTHF